MKFLDKKDHFWRLASSSGCRSLTHSHPCLSVCTVLSPLEQGGLEAGRLLLSAPDSSLQQLPVCTCPSPVTACWAPGWTPRS